MPLPAGAESGDRRRVERRVSQRLADLTLPEFRRILLTSTLFVIVLAIFLWMVRVVIIAAILAMIVAAYIRPLYLRILSVVRRPILAALLSIVCIIVPLIAVVVYSYAEMRQATVYVSQHQDEVVARIDNSVRRLPFLERSSFSGQIRTAVLTASNYGAKILGELKDVIAEVAVATAVFLFTMGYIFTEAETIGRYIRGLVPARYAELSSALERNVSGVLYGAVYGTLITQTIKSVVILIMMVAFGVPLAGLLAILSFVIGFFPIVGSWSVYVPVAIYLIIFREAYLSAALMLIIGFIGNTLFLSMYIRPKLAAEKSRVLNFYWMFIGLVTGVYTFGIVGILLGPIIIGLLKAVFDTVTAQANWRLLDAEGEPATTAAVAASEALGDGPGV